MADDESDALGREPVWELDEEEKRDCMLWKIVFYYYFVMSIISALMHLWDKHQAIQHRWRVKEKTLHSVELMGGWPGAWLMIRSINHKVSKRSYMRVLYAIAIGHLALWLFLLWIVSH